MSVIPIIKYVLLMLWILCANGDKGRSESKTIWLEKLEKLQELAEEHNLKENLHQQHERTTGMGDFNVNFKCDPKPMTVHQLRPRDIDVVAGMGDSITAANGAEATSVNGILTEYRGVSWTTGGDASLESTLTLPNILRKFNPKVKGYSVGTRFDANRDWWFNFAVPGAKARGMTGQAQNLINAMKADNRTNFENDWKIVTIFVGGNDLCANGLLLQSSTSPEKYIEYLTEALDVLHSGMRRTLVNLVEILEIHLLPEIGTGYGSTEACREAQLTECTYVVNASADEMEKIKNINKQYQTLTQQLVESGRYDDRDDFTVVLQPFLRNTVLPYTEDGQVDSTFFAPDCFHFSSKGHAMGAINLWNNMLEPVGQKSTEWKITNLKVPTEEYPYIFTNKNSYIGGSGSEIPVTTSKPTSTAAPLICDEVCTDSGDVEDWIIAVICLLGVAVILQTFAFIWYCQKRKSSKTKVKF